jgi:hypothetical protein
MKALPITALAVSLVLGSALSAQRPQPQTGPDVSKAIDTYCSGCHNGRMRSPGGALLDQFDAAGIPAAPELWSRASSSSPDITASRT